MLPEWIPYASSCNIKEFWEITCSSQNNQQMLRSDAMGDVQTSAVETSSQVEQSKRSHIMACNDPIKVVEICLSRMNGKI